jgi:tetratricopeptide (TPR) repeat protein
VKPDPKEDISLKMKKVLIVEDFFNFRLTIKNMLRSFGVLYIDDAASGEEAIRKMAARKFDIILCDYNLGQGKSGQQVLEEGKYRGYVHYTTVFIMVTAENTMDMIMGAVEYQPDDYLMKPFAKEVLERKIKNIIEKKDNFRDIDIALTEADYSKALNLSDELIAKSPRNLSELMKMKGEILLKMGAYKEASDFFDKVLLMGNVNWALLGQGRVDLMTGKYQEAKNIFESIIAKNDKIITAYDYLAKTLLKMNDPRSAQEVLTKAVSISPRAILRQKNLGSIAYRNEDFSTAESSFKSAVAQGKHSCFKSPTDYTNLAKTLVQRDATAEGLAVLNNALTVFPDDSDAKLHVSVAESYVYKKMNKDDEARKSMAQAQKMIDDLAGEIPHELQLDMAKAYIMIGDKEKGTEMIKHIVQGNHDNEEILDNVRIVFREAGMEDKGNELIEDTRKEIIKLNNEGVKLAQEGKMAESYAYFEKAATHLPENKIINANAAQILMLFMKEKGTNEKSLKDAKTYLDRVRKIDESYADLPMLLSMYSELNQLPPED